MCTASNVDDRQKEKGGRAGKIDKCVCVCGGVQRSYGYDERPTLLHVVCGRRLVHAKAVIGIIDVEDVGAVDAVVVVVVAHGKARCATLARPARSLVCPLCFVGTVKEKK